jgi:hypothetical protein
MLAFSINGMKSVIPDGSTGVFATPGFASMIGVICVATP